MRCNEFSAKPTSFAFSSSIGDRRRVGMRRPDEVRMKPTTSNQMRGILFGFLFILIAATLVVYVAIVMQSQEEWAREICRAADPICEATNFYWLLAATATVAILFLLSGTMDT